VWHIKNKYKNMIYKDLKIESEDLSKYVAVLSSKEKDLINYKSFDFGSSFFNVITDNFGNFVVSAEEISNIIDKEYEWMKSLELIEYVAIDYSNSPLYASFK
jgi:alpha-N-acetylglucosamine transferase